MTLPFVGAVAALPLREYQRETIDQLAHHLRPRSSRLTAFFKDRGPVDDDEWRAAAVLPTGAGKTVIFAHIVKEWQAVVGRICIIVHRDELVAQTVNKLHTIAPHLSVGVVKAAANQVNADVIVASVQTLARPSRRAQIVGVGLVIVDECHHATARIYRETLDYFGCFDLGRRTLCVGFTATLHRADGDRLGDIWQRAIVPHPITWYIEHGYLSHMAGVRVEVPDLDLSKVKRARGDYQDSDLDDAMSHSMAPQVIATSYVEHCSLPSGGPRKGVLFAPGVESAGLMADALRDVGVRAELVSGMMPLAERRRVLAAHDAGQLDVVANCAVLTEGWDSPATEVAVMARPTSSAGLYMQCIGRVARPFPGKLVATVLDVVGVTAKHRVATLVDLDGRPPRDPSEGDDDLDVGDNAEELLGGGLPALRDSLYEGPVVGVEVDLFGSSRHAWGRTDDGYWFVASTVNYFAVFPGEQPGTFDLIRYGKQAGQGGMVQTGIADLSYAMAIGEQALAGDPQTFSAKDASWRKRGPTQKARDLATRMRVPYTADTRGGELADRIDAKFASRRIDPKLTPWLTAKGRLARKLDGSRADELVNA